MRALQCSAGDIMAYMYHVDETGEILWSIQPFFEACHPPRVSRPFFSNTVHSTYQVIIQIFIANRCAYTNAFYVPSLLMKTQITSSKLTDVQHSVNVAPLRSYLTYLDKMATTLTKVFSKLGSCLGLKYLCHSINTIPQRNALFYSTSMPFHRFAQHKEGGASALTLVWYQQIDFKTYRKLCAQHQALQLK